MRSIENSMSMLWKALVQVVAARFETGGKVNGLATSHAGLCSWVVRKYVVFPTARTQVVRLVFHKFLRIILSVNFGFYTLSTWPIISTAK